jgi:hypothetical protein
MERPALQGLLADIRARRLDIVVVYKVDRLTRALADFARLVEIFDAQGASFVSVTQQFNTTSFSVSWPPPGLSRRTKSVSARAIGPSNRLGRLSTVPAIRAENTSNPPWPNAWRVAARNRLKIEPRNGAGIDACGADEPMVVLYLPR